MKQEEYVAQDSGVTTGLGEKPTVAYTHSSQMTSIESQNGDAPSLGLIDVFKIAWRNRMILAMPIALAILGSLALLLFFASSSATNSYQYAFQLTFKGSEYRQYPNGETFNLQDIIAPNVIDAVYKDAVKNKDDLSVTDFHAAISITAYSPSREFIIKKFRDRLSVRGLTLAEINELQSQLERELDLATRRAALLAFDNSEVRLPPEDVKLAMKKILQEWNKYSIEKRGVQKLNFALLEASFINEASIAGSDSSGLLRSLVVIHRKVKDYVEALSELQIGTDLRDPLTGQTFESLSTRLSFISARIVEVAKGLLTDVSGVSVGVGNMISSESFNQFPVDNVDPQIAFEILLKRLSDAQSNIRGIRSLPFGDVVKDPKSGLTITDLASALEEIENFQIKPLRDKSLKDGLSDDRITLKTFYEQRLGDLQRKREAVGSVVTAIENANSNYRNGGPSLNGTGSNSPSNNNSITPQFDGDFLDRLIAVTGESKSSEFRQGLVTRALKLHQEASELDSGIAVLKENLRLLEQGKNTIQTSSRKSEQEAHRKTINGILERLKEQLDVTVRISKRIALAQSLSDVLVNELGLEKDDRRIHPVIFLSASSVTGATVPDVLSEMQGIIEIANRIKENLAIAVYGSNTLFSPLAEPEILKTPILTKQSILLMALLLVLGLIVSGMLLLTKLFRFSSLGKS